MKHRLKVDFELFGSNDKNTPEEKKRTKGSKIEKKITKILILAIAFIVAVAFLLLSASNFIKEISPLLGDLTTDMTIQIGQNLVVR